MQTLDDLRTQIDSLRSLTSSKEIQDKIQEIFYDLIYADQPLYVKMSDSAPQLSQATLYLYSHPGMGGEAFGYTDVLQMSVYAMKNGAKKIILNDGDKWVMIGIPDFLKIFYERICNTPDLFDYEFVKSIMIGDGYKLEGNSIVPCENSRVTKDEIGTLDAEEVTVTLQDDESGFNVSKDKLLKALEWRNPVSDWHFGEIENFNLSYQENIPQQENPPAKKPSRKIKKIRPEKPRKKMTLKVAAGLCAAVLLLCVGSILTFSHFSRAKQFDEFCLYIDRMDYSNAHVSYLENNFGAKADKYLSGHLDGLIDSYAGNMLDSGELEGALMGLENFEVMEKNLQIAKITAAELERSKNAFVEGQQESDAYRKLLAWEGVIELDRVNYAAVQEEVKNNQGNLVTALDKNLSYYDTRAWDFANSRYKVMEYWFPRNTTTLSWSQKYSGSGEQKAKFCPITISKVQITPNIDGYWNLYINWKNASVKPIQYICFSVTAINSDGEYVVCTDANGSWSIFDAVDINLYGAASGPEAGSYGWADVFYGSEVADVKLTGINITYSDNSTDTFTNPVDLKKMQTFM